MHRVLFVLVAVSSLLAACGSPSAGDGCDQAGFLCADATAALECKGGTWTLLPCKGADGCKREGDIVKCDMRGNVAGDECASTAEGKGMCSSTGKSTLECRQGKLVETNTCSTCTVVGDQVQCQKA